MVTYAFIYTRVSSKKQVAEGNGLDAQERACRRKAEQLGYKVVSVFPELGITGASSERPAFTGMLAEVGHFQHRNRNSQIVILMDDVSRLSRNLLIHIQLKSQIEKVLKARIEYVQHKFEDTPEGRALENIYSVFASLERDRNQVRVKERMRARFQNGVDVYGRAKMGYVYGPILGCSGNIQTPHLHNAPIIAQALKRYAYGELTSAKQVKAYLDRKQIVHEQGRFKGQPRKTSLSTIKTMLENSYFYAGFIKNEKNGYQLQEGKHEAIIDVDVYNRIQERLKGRPAAYAKATEDDYLLKGWVECDDCNNLLTSNGQGSRGQSKKKYHYYYCRNGRCPSYKKGMPPHTVHKDFETLLSQIRCHPQFLQICENAILKIWSERIKHRKSIRTEAKRKLAVVEQQIDSSASQIIFWEAEYMREPLRKKLEQLHAEKVKLQKKIAEPLEHDYDIEQLVNRVNWLFESPIALWRKAELKDKRTMMKLLFPLKLSYKRGEGFRKPLNPLKHRLIDVFEEEKSGLVV